MPTSMKLLDLIERNAEELTQQWIRTIQNDPETPTYHSFEEATLHDRAYNVYRNLGRWISHKTAEKDVAAVYTELGSTRHGEGFALSEVVLALIFSRQILWNKMQDEGLLDNALDLHMAHELRNRIAHFFDRATYYIVKGFEEVR